MIQANYKKQETVSRLKKAYSTLAQAINHSQFENGSIAEWYENNKSSNDLFNTYFKKYLRTSKVTQNYKEAGYEKSNPFVYSNGGEVPTLIGKTDNSRASFLLDDGVFVMVYTSSTDEDGNPLINSKPFVFVDINAGKKPNKFGRDVFSMQIDSTKGLQPTCYSWTNESNKKNDCSKSGQGNCCTYKIINDGWEIKEDYPW